MSDIFQDAQSELDQQATIWGREAERNRPLRKALTVMRAIAARVKQLEDRVTALEQKP